MDKRKTAGNSGLKQVEIWWNFRFARKKIKLKTEKLTVTKPPPALSHETLYDSLKKTTSLNKMFYSV